MKLACASLRTADVFPVVAERSDDRKYVCCSKARLVLENQKLNKNDNNSNKTQRADFFSTSTLVLS